MPVYNAWSSDRKAKDKTIWSSGDNCTELIQTLNKGQSKANTWFLCLKFVHLCVKGNTGSYCCTLGAGDLSEFLCPIPRGILWGLNGNFDKSPRGEPLINTLSTQASTQQYQNLSVLLMFVLLLICVTAFLASPRILKSTPWIPDSSLESGFFVSRTWIQDSNHRWDSGFIELFSGF